MGEKVTFLPQCVVATSVNVSQKQYGGGTTDSNFQINTNTAVTLSMLSWKPPQYNRSETLI